MMRIAGLALLFVFFLPSQTSAQTSTAELRTQGLVVQGHVTRLEVQSDKDSVFFFVTLDVEFTNAGAEPIILFKSSVDNSALEGKYWLGGWSLYLSEADAATGQDVFSDGYWESVIGATLIDF